MSNKVNTIVDMWWRQATVLVLLMIFVMADLSATHIIGGNITYKKVGDELFEITFTMRRDCELGSPEAQFDDPAVLGIYGLTGGLQFNLGDQGRIIIPYMADDTLNEFIMSDCGFEGEQVCVHETRYIKTVRLPYRSGGYIISYQRCCRNASLNNVLDPLSTGATYSVRIGEEALLEQNSSPVFEEWPDVYICANEDLVFDHGAVDADGDSLVYRLCVPRNGASPDRPQPQPPAAPPYDPIDFLPPFGLDNLLGGVPLEIDPETGVLTANPNTVGQFVVGICVEEYRDGVLIGEVNRDFQYNVRVCSDPPTADFSSPSANCDGLTLPFTNESLSTTGFEWNFNYPSTDSAFISTEDDPVFTFPETGTYQVQLIAVRNTDQCSDTIVKTVNVFDADYIADFSATVDSCNEDGTVTVRLQDQSTISSVGVETEQWSWTIAQAGDTTVLTGQDVIVELAAGDFDVTLDVVATNDCIASVTKSVPYSDIELQADFDVKVEGCLQESTVNLLLTDLTSQVSPNFEIETTVWTVVTSTSMKRYSGSSVEVEIPREDVTITLEVLAKNGCSATITKSIPVGEFISEATFDYSSAGCNDDGRIMIDLLETVEDTLTFAVVSGFDWLVGADASTGATSTTALEAGDSILVQLTVTYDNGCTSSIQQMLYADEVRPQVKYTYEAEECPSDETVRIKFSFEDSLVKGVAYDNVQWQIGPSSDIQSLNGEEVVIELPKDSTISVTLSADFDNGCRDEISDTILPGPFATLDFVSDTLVICPNEARPLFASGNPDLSYSYSPETGLDLSDPSNPIVSITADQVYSVTVTDGLCEVTGDIFVDILESIDIVISGEDFTCDGAIDLLASGGVGEGEYQWSEVVDFSTILFEGSNLVSNFDGNSKTYYVRWIGEVCSANPAEITVVNQTPNIEIFEPYEVCASDTFQYTTLNSILSHDITIMWDDHPYIVDGNATLTPTIAIPQDITEAFELSFVASNQFGCEMRDTVSFVIGNNPVVDWSYNVEDCGNYTVCFEVEGSYNGFPKWDFGDLTTTDDTSPLAQVCYTYPGPGTYAVTLENASLVCPFATVTKQVVLNESIEIFDGDDVEACIDSEYILAVPQSVAGLTYTWCDLSGSPLSSEEELTILVDQTKSVVLKVIDENGCPFQDTFTVRAFDFSTEVIVPDVYCEGMEAMVSINVDGNLDYVYAWGPEDCIVSGQGTAQVIIDVQERKNLTVTVTHPSLGCTVTEEVEITPTSIDVDVDVSPGLEIFLGADATIEVINQQDDWSYQWSNGDTTGTIVVSPTEQTIYTVTVTDELGCTGEASVTIEIDEPVCEEDVYLPNAFTPNGDGNNDVFYVRSNFVTDMELVIYDRWGEQVFRSTDINVGWDGTYKGVALGADAYAYYLRARCSDNDEIVKQGNVSLLR